MKKVLLSLFSLGIMVPALAQLPVSTSPENKNVVLEEFTGINCVYCPDGHKRANQLAANNQGDVVLINVHAGGYAAPGAGQPDFRTTDGQAIDAQANVSGYPAGTINRRVFSNFSQNPGGWAMGRADWASAASTVLGESSYVNVALEGDIDLATRTLTVNVEAYFTGSTAPSSVRLNVALLEDSIFGPQTGASNFYPAMVLPDGRYVHMHMLRDLITPTWGDTISTTTMGTLFTKTYTYTIPQDVNGIPISLGNLDIAAFIAEGRGPVITGAKGPITYTAPAGASITDLSLDATSALPSSYCDNQITPEVKIDNVGGSAASNFEVSYTLNGGTPVTQTVSSSVAAGGSTTVTFPAVTLSNGINNLSYDVSTANNNMLFDLSSGNNIDGQADIITMPSSTFGTYFYEDMEAYAFNDVMLNHAIVDNQTSSYVTPISSSAVNGLNRPLGAFENSAVSLFFYFFNIQAGEKGSLVFEKLDLSSTSYNEIVFAHAYRQYDANSDDELNVKVSTDCGQSWTTVWSKSGADLATGAVESGNFFPAAADWQWDTIRIPQYDGTPELMVKFEGVSDYGNNLFIDDIQFKNNTYVGEQEYQAPLNVTVYPNPVQGKAQIEFPLSEDADVRLELTDVAGKIVLQQRFADQTQGRFRRSLDLSHLPAGVYHLNLRAGDAQHNQKLIVQ